MNYQKLIKVTFLFSVVCAVCFSSGKLRAQEFYVPDDAPASMARIGDVIYLGGPFKNFGPATGSFAVINRTTYALQSGWPRVSGAINAILSDDMGGFYIAGEIIKIGTTLKTGVVHINPDKTLDTNFSAEANGSIFALAKSGDVIYVGGDFSFISGEYRSNLAALDKTTGTATTLDLSPNGAVRALRVYNNSPSVLYVGGEFKLLGGYTRKYIGAVNIDSGAVMGWNPSANGSVKAILAISGTVYVGGSFSGTSSIGGADRNYLAAIDMTTGTAHPWAPNPTGDVNKIELYDLDHLLVGGAFTQIAGAQQNFLAKVTLSTPATLIPWDLSPNGEIYTAYKVDSQVIFGGDFNEIGDDERMGVGAVNASGELTDFDLRINGSVKAIANNDTLIALGGSFTASGMESRNYLAALDANSGQLLPEALTPALDGEVFTLATDGNDLYLGGSFSSIGGKERKNVASIDILGNVRDWNPGANGKVYDMTSNGSWIYLGGQFSEVAGAERRNIAAVSLDGALNQSFSPTMDGAVQVIEVDDDGTVYIGGYFSTVNEQDRHALASLDSTGSVTSWDPNPSSTVEAILLGENTVYVGGSFVGIGGKSRRYLAEVSKTSNSLTEWNPSPNGLVTSLSLFNSKLIVGGFFNNIGGAVRTGVASLDRATGFADSWNPELSGPATVFGNFEHQLLAGGYFDSVNFEPLGFLADVTPLISTDSPLTPAGTPIDGGTLTANDGSWNGLGSITVSRKWQRCAPVGLGCYDIESESEGTYVLTKADVGNRIRTVSTVTDSLMSSEEASPVTNIVAPLNTKAPKISGVLRVGRTLSASSGSWNGVWELTISYQWKRCGKKCSNISKAKSARYKLTKKDLGKKLLVVVSASKNSSVKTSASSKKTKKVT